MRDKIVAGNWKMNGESTQINHLLSSILQMIPQEAKAKVVVLPPAVYLPLVAERLRDSAIQWGGQNVYPADKGAFTGEISGPMLVDSGCRYVLVGHSERRQIFHENEKFVAEKFHHVKEHGMIPVLCVGETLAEREAGKTQAVIASQLAAVANKEKGGFTKAVIAYEPVWAIGTGVTASPEQAQEVHQFIRTFVAELNETDAVRLPILYGGSVNEKNAGVLFAMPDVDGGLVGGASLNAEQFVEIVKCIN